MRVEYLKIIKRKRGHRKKIITGWKMQKKMKKKKKNERVIAENLK